MMSYQVQMGKVFVDTNHNHRNQLHLIITNKSKIGIDLILLAINKY